MLKIGLLAIGVLCFQSAMFAQHRVDPSNSYHRVIGIVPMVGSGTWDDPKRPMFAPHASQIGRERSGILAYYHELTDDGTAAIVVFVAADRSAFQSILSSNDHRVQIFQPEKHSQQEVENALKAVRKDFDWRRFAVRVP